ncbi:hypothetical protein [Tumebacillus flagellatus]|nr:hypothetical protein [Tumebacillus flagellatus]
MLTKISRLARLLAVATALYGGAKQMRGMYVRRKHLWQILRRLVRQLG